MYSMYVCLALPNGQVFLSLCICTAYIYASLPNGQVFLSLCRCTACMYASLSPMAKCSSHCVDVQHVCMPRSPQWPSVPLIVWMYSMYVCLALPNGQVFLSLCRCTACMYASLPQWPSVPLIVWMYSMYVCLALPNGQVFL